MNMLRIKNPGYYILIALLFFQGASGLLGGTALVLNPSGKTLQMPLTLLKATPFDTFLIPGIILLLVLGVFPLIVLYGLVVRKAWAWTATVLVSIALITWIGVEIAMIGYHPDPPLQLVYGLVGVILLILTQLPSVQGIREKRT